MTLFKLAFSTILCIACVKTLHCRADKILSLHYDRAAKYFEEALPIGNGTMGAMVYNDVESDKLTLNDITLWTGNADTTTTNPLTWQNVSAVREALFNEDYRAADTINKNIQGHFSESYQPLATLTITYLKDIETQNDSINAQESTILRTLDISNALASSICNTPNGKRKIECLASNPDSTIVINITTTNRKGINAIIKLTSKQPHKAKNEDNKICISGYCAYHAFPSYYKLVADSIRTLYDSARGMRFATVLKVINNGQNGVLMDNNDGEIIVKGCHDITLIIVNTTSFKDPFTNPVVDEGICIESSYKRINRLTTKTWSDLLASHTADYHKFFNRMSINLGQTDSTIAKLSIDEQLKLYSQQGVKNPELEALYVQYGRYLLISCSRTFGVPANLQGLWNENITPPWSCNYTTNINLEENYWPAETANLSEMHMPLMEFMERLSQTGSITAQNYYGVNKGWCLGHNTDIWAMTNPVGLQTGDPSWANWNMGAAWLSTHIWEHYLFSMDKDFLTKYYPILKGAAEFLMNWLVDKDGYFITSPSTSPENIFIDTNGYQGSTFYGGFADLAMARECFYDVTKAAKTLCCDSLFVEQIDSITNRLLPYRISSDGRLQEWYYDWKDKDPKHRHQSHLFGLYPGHHITLLNTPKEAEACAKTLEVKGDKTTGWSLGWRVCLYARLGDGASAYRLFHRLLSYVSPSKYKGEDAIKGGGSYTNLLCSHPPFQIDGNFGGCAGAIEMLMQSTLDRITLLPALPQEWKDGSVSGICARGGFIVDMSWHNGCVTELTITSRKGGKTNIHFNGEDHEISAQPGEKITVL